MKSTRFTAAGAAFRALVAALMLALIAASGTGCGQRGPLYLPDAEPGADGPAATGDAEAWPASPGEGGADESEDSEDTE